jgi:hypothetical protein
MNGTQRAARSIALKLRVASLVGGLPGHTGDGTAGWGLKSINIGPIRRVFLMTYIIVRRGDYQLYDRLYGAFGSVAAVVWDQRRTRPTDADVASTPPEDRRHEPPVSWMALGFVVVDRPLT